MNGMNKPTLYERIERLKRWPTGSIVAAFAIIDEMEAENKRLCKDMSEKNWDSFYNAEAIVNELKAENARLIQDLRNQESMKRIADAFNKKCHTPCDNCVEMERRWEKLR